MRKIFGKFITFSAIVLPSLLPASSITTWTDTGGGAGDMTDSGNWSSGVPDSTTIASFDSSIPSINNNPSIAQNAATSNFVTPSFDFVNSASFFTFDIGGPFGLVFSGPGITGTNTNTTITAENSNSSMSVPYQILFSNTNAIPVTTGAAIIIANNDSSALINSDFPNVNDVAQILFDGSPSLNVENSSIVLLEGAGSLQANSTNNSSILNNISGMNDIGQIVFDGSGSSNLFNGASGNSNVTITGSYSLQATNGSGCNIQNNGNSNSVGQIIFDGSSGYNPLGDSVGHSFVTLENQTTIEATNNGMIVNQNLFAGDLAQILFDGNGGVNGGFDGQGNSIVNMNGSVLTAISDGGTAIQNNNYANDLAQIVFDGSGGYGGGSNGTGHSTVTIDELVLSQLTATLQNGASINNSGDANDVGQIVFDGSGGLGQTSGGTGHSTVTINRGVLTATVADSGSSINNFDIANDVVQILFDGSGGTSNVGNGTGNSTVTIGGTASFHATLEGVISNVSSANDLAQILFDGSGGTSNTGSGTGHSTVTISDSASFVILNDHLITSSGPCNDIGQIIFDGSGGHSLLGHGIGQSTVTIGGTASFQVSNNSSITSTSRNANDLAQVLFDGSGGFGASASGTGQSIVSISDNAVFDISNSGLISSSSSFVNDLAQVLFDGSGGFGLGGSGIGHSTVTIDGAAAFNLTLDNASTITSSASANDLAQILFDGSGGFSSGGSGTGHSTVTIGGTALFNATLADGSSITNSSTANDLAQILFDGSGGLSLGGGGIGASTVIIGGTVSMIATNDNTSTISTTNSLNSLSQILFDGSGGFGLGGSGTGHSTVTINGSASLSAINNNVLQTSSFYSNDSSQILFNGSGGFSINFPGAGNSTVTIGESASLSATNSGAISNNNTGNTNDIVQILFDGSGGLGNIRGNSGSSVVMITDNATIVAANTGTIANNQTSNEIAQIAFDGSSGMNNSANSAIGASTVTIGNQVKITASNSGTIINNTGITSKDLAQILFDGSSLNGASTGSSDVTIGDQVVISAMNSGIITNLDSLSGLAQILFDGRGGSSTLTVTGTPLIAAVNSGTVNGDQIAFYDTTIIGSPTLKASNQGGTLIAGRGISFYGSTTATTPNIVLESSSLWIAAEVPSFFSIGSLTGDSTSTVPLDHTLNIFTQTGITAEFDGVIGDFSGTNDVVISGTGMQVFGGPNTYGGTTTINGGNLALTNTGIIPHDAIVNSTGVLSGSGTVEGNVLVNYGGTVFPGIGTSLGTLSVGQNYTQEAGATLLINVSGALINGVPQSSQLDVVGTATLAGTLEVISTNGTYSIGRPYTILTAGTAIVGSFDQQVFTISPYLVVDVTYIRDPSVEIVLSTDFVAGAQTVNQAHVALQFDSTAVPTGDEEVVINDLLALPAAEVPSALDAMSGEQYAYLVQVNQYSDYRFGRRIFDAVRDSLDPCACEASCGSVHAWAVTEVGYGRTTGDSEAHGFNEFDVVTSGGIHRTCSPCTLFGIAYNAEGARLDFGLGSHNTMYNVQGSFYGMYTSPEFYVFSDLIVGQGYTHFKRHIDFGDLHRTAHCTPRFSHGVIYAECGCDVPLCEVLMQPFVGADLGYTYAQSFVERGADSLNLHVKERSLWTPNLYLGAHFTSLIRCIECNADLIYQHRFGSLGTTLHSRFDFGDTFTVSGRELSRNGFIGNINFSTHANECVDFYLELSGELWDHQYWCAGSIGVKRVW